MNLRKVLAVGLCGSLLSSHISLAAITQRSMFFNMAGTSITESVEDYEEEMESEGYEEKIESEEDDEDYEDDWKHQLSELNKRLEEEYSKGDEADWDLIERLEAEIAELQEDFEDKPSTNPSIGPGSELGDVTKEDDVVIKSPSTQQKEDIGDEVGDLVITDKVYTTNGKTRVTEVYSVNNQYADCYYRPKLEDIPLLGERVCKMGQYTAAYTGFFDIGWKEAYKPRGEQSRALEILGYDFLFKDESFDVATKKYSHTLIGNNISQETAIMNIYKALGLEQYDIKMYHTRGSYTSGSSPVGSLLNRSTLVYNIKKSNSNVTDTFDGYETYVFVTRSNPLLYMRKLQNDFNISINSDKSVTVTLEDFIIMCYKMMSFYGEPVLSEQETNQLLQVYGAEVPTGMSKEFKEAWMYLKARGVLNIDNYKLNGNLTKGDMYEILMCVKDRDSRTNYKEVQLSYNLNTDIVNKGYYPITTTVTEVDKIDIEGQVSYENCTVYDYLVPINDYSTFYGQTGEELRTQFVSDNPEAANMLLPGSAYVGIVDDRYYHFIIPIDDPAKVNGYYRVDTLSEEDKPCAVMLFEGGGIYKLDSSTGTGKNKVNYFKRRPFSEVEYPDYVDKERKSGINDFDYDTWGGGTDYIYVKDEDTNKDVKPDINDTYGLDNWEGPYCKRIITTGSWIQESSSGKWRYVETEADDHSSRYFLDSGGYYIGETSSGDVAANLFMFDIDGYMITGWYSDGNLWAYFDDTGHLVYDTTINIDGQDYEFDQWGWWIDGVYNIPPDREDDWGYLANIAGDWVYDDGEEKWWYMLNTGDYLFSGVYKINDKLYAFDDYGWMIEGWYEENDSYYYFYPGDGHMAMNTTVDGYRVGHNGRAIGKVKIGFNTRVKSMYAKVTSMFKPMVTYADTMPGVKNSLGSLVSTGSSREYRVKIYDGTVVETYDEIQQKVRATGVKARFEKSTSAWSGVPYIVVISQLNQERVASLLTFKSNADNLTLVNTQMAITQFGTDKESDMSMLVPFEELVEAGLFTDRVNISSDGNEIQLWGISSSTLEDGNMNNRRHGFGEIRLNKADNTIMVGPTVYTLRKNQQLWYMVPADDKTVKSYNFIDKDGNQAQFDDNLLYVDLRVVYGWSANEVKFYQMNTSADGNLTTEKQIIVSAGKATIVDGSGNEKVVEVKQVNVTPVGGSNRTIHWNSARILPNYTADGHHALLAANSYQLATWCLLVSNSTVGTDQVNLVTYYPKLAFTQLGIKEPVGDEGIAGLKKVVPEGRKVPETDEHVCRVTQIQVKGTSSSGATLEVGSWYRDKDFGYIYIMPTSSEWESNNGYSKWLSNEWLLPMISKDLTQTSTVVDMSIPAFDSNGAKYGDRRVGSNTTKMVQCIASLSRYLYKEPEISDRTLSSARSSTSHTSDNVYEAYMFGIHPMDKEGSNWKIYGIGTIGNKSFSVKESEIGELKFLRPIRVYQNTFSGQTGAREYEIYTSVPTNITYVETTGESSNVGTQSVLGGDRLNTFRDFESFTFNDFVNRLDAVLALIILAAVEVLPIILFTCSMIVFGFSMMSDFKLVKYICNKYFDPIKFLTHGVKNIETAGGIRFIVCVLFVTIGLALCIDGNIIKVLNWIFTVVGSYLNMLNKI